MENKKFYVPVPISAVILNLVMGIVLTGRVGLLFIVFLLDDFKRSSYDYMHTISSFQSLYIYFILFVLSYILFNILLYKYKDLNYNRTDCSRYIAEIVLIMLIPILIFLGIPFASGFLMG